MRWRSTLLAVFFASLVSIPVFAQEQGGDRGNQGGGGGAGMGGPGGGGGRGNFDPAQMRQRMMDGIKEQLKPSDEEWQVLQPKIEAVLTAQRNARAGGMGMMWGGRGGGGGRGPGGGGDDTELGRASRELRTLLQSEGADAKDIATRLEAYRAARAKAEEQLKTARAELKDLVTQRQEAVLVMATLLE
jgi:hypothetical protein